MKAGDKVKIINVDNRPDLVLGSIRTVVLVSDVCVELDNTDPTYTFTAMSRLELMPEAPKVAGVKPGTQLDKVLKLTLGQGSWTLSGIAAATGASEAAASARLRDLRALGYTVTCSKPAGVKLRRYTVRSEVIALT